MSSFPAAKAAGRQGRPAVVVPDAFASVTAFGVMPVITSATGPDIGIREFVSVNTESKVRVVRLNTSPDLVMLTCPLTSTCCAKAAPVYRPMNKRKSPPMRAFLDHQRCTPGKLSVCAVLRREWDHFVLKWRQVRAEYRV